MLGALYRIISSTASKITGLFKPHGKQSTHDLHKSRELINKISSDNSYTDPIALAKEINSKESKILLLFDVDGVLRENTNGSLVNNPKPLDPYVEEALTKLNGLEKFEVALLTSREQSELEPSGILKEISRFGCSGSFVIAKGESKGNYTNDAEWQAVLKQTNKKAEELTKTLQDQYSVKINTRISPGRFFLDIQAENKEALLETLRPSINQFLQENENWYIKEDRDGGMMLEDKLKNFKKSDGVDNLLKYFNDNFSHIVFVGDTSSDVPAMETIEGHSKKYNYSFNNIAVGDAIPSQARTDRFKSRQDVQVFIHKLAA